MPTRDNLVKQLQIQRELEWRRCAASFTYWYFKFWTVQGRTGRMIVEPWEMQTDCAKLMETESRLCFLKARQIGWSTTITAYCVWMGFFAEDKRIRVISHRKDDAEDLIKMMRYGLTFLPAWMLERGPKSISDRKGDIEWDNNSIIVSDSPSTGGGQGKTLDLLVLDEFGKIQDPEGLWASALPAAEHGKIIVLGNPNGEGTRWWRICEEAKAGSSEFTYRFYPWFAAPYRDADWYTRNTASMTASEKAMTYPADDVEAWVAAGSPVFDYTSIMRLTENTYEGGPIELESASFVVWKDYQQGAPYAAGIDIAFGKANGDHSVMDIIRVDTGEHVASLHCQVEPHDLARIVLPILKQWGSPLTAWEVNGEAGKAFTNAFMSSDYRNFYRRRALDGSRGGWVNKNGWVTTDATKGVLISALAAALYGGEDEDNERLTTYSPEHCKELRAYRHLHGGRMGGIPHDDRVMSLGIALQAAKQHRAWKQRQKGTDALAGTTTPLEPARPAEVFLEANQGNLKKAWAEHTAYYGKTDVDQLEWGKSKTRSQLMRSLR